MSDTYTKLFSSITESTVWGEPYSTRIVWVAMLAMADSKGHVFGSIPGLARRANVTLAECESALQAFLAPDPYSRTQDEDGRRIEDIDGGWRLINHGKYSAVRDASERREYQRQWDREHRPSGQRRVKQSDTSPTKSDKSEDSDPTSTNTSTKEQERSASAGAEAPTRLDAIPYQAIANAYNATLTGLPKVREVTNARRTAIRREWQASPQRRSLAFWQAYFAECADDSFLNGTGPYREPHAHWRPDFDHLLLSKTVTKVFERAMDRLERAD